MHSSLSDEEVSTESRDVIGSLWTPPPSSQNYAFA